MDLTPWAPAIALGGVVLGVVMTFVGQWLTRRQNSVLSIEKQKAALRNDRREAIYHFLEAAQAVNSIAENQSENLRGVITTQKTIAEAKLVFRKNCIAMVCRPDLRTATQEYTTALLGILWGIIPVDMKLREVVYGPEQNFFELARTELYAHRVSD